MNKWQKDVLEFHKKFACVTGEFPSTLPKEQYKHRLSLIKEEYEEMQHAEKVNDLVEIADALADLLYVVIGTAVAHGIDIDPIWNEVHKTNMAKVGGGTREDGKVLKPEGWKPPDIEKLIHKQLGFDKITSLPFRGK